ncbi:MAG: Fe-S cluster assembly protein SufD [Bacteroidia bacterium]|nr:MAG: Fe-S cluster assembly protein SufD [Bacteroidia bacterium]
MNTMYTTLIKDKLLELFETEQHNIRGNATPMVNRIRKHALTRFKTNGFPTTKKESWRFTDLTPLLNTEFAFDFRNQSKSTDIEKIFTCDVYDLDTYSHTLLNGWLIYKHAPLTRLADGTIVGSLAKAMEVYPDLVDRYLGKAAATEQHEMAALNTAFLQDGLFIFVPENTNVEKPVQLINIVNAEQPVFLQPRHLVIVGKNASITLVHCDHSLTHNISFTNTVLEVFAEEGARVEHYKMQNKGRNSALITHSFFHQKENSRVSSNIITLNGGFTKNIVEVTIDGTKCESDHYGLYLVDSNQHVDNQLNIDHRAPGSTSNQLYKGILDDEAKAVFSGKVMVRRHAQQTKAFQNNKNILLTDEAKANTQPHLEIYADDVKCSHGATVGQLDPNAMFYLRSRGLCERTARQMMMIAFAGEVVQKISIDALRARITNMVEKRLKGELSICEQCVLHCNSKEPTSFNIDLSKL